MKTIGLCMIVKNEAPIILRCLDSVRPLVDYVLIEDTGSLDGTQDVIRAYLEREKLPGAVFEEPWRDFAYNRSLALARLREHRAIDYALIMDADDTLVLADGFDQASFKSSLVKDFYSICLHVGAIEYYRPLICSNRKEFYFRGVLHEFLVSPDGSSSDIAAGMHVIGRREGARSQDPDKYRKDAATLEQALRGEDDAFMRARYTFYLAQSWRDCGETEKALAAYLDRAALGFWDQEVFISLYNAAKLKETLDHPGLEIIGMFLKAYEACPHRTEALHGAARYCRISGNFHQGYMIANQGLELERPPGGGLFIEPWIYDYGLLDEFAVNAYWAHRYQDCVDACERLLREGKLAAEVRERVAANAAFAREKLEPAPSPPVGAVMAPAPPPQATWLTPETGAAAPPPRVFLAILAKQKEPILPFYLLCLDALDYPKDRIALYIRSNNNTDRTADILRDWLAQVGTQYASVEFDASDVAEKLESYGVHEWNALRNRVLGQIRQSSLQKALDAGADFYFVVDVDNFIAPGTLRRLVEANLPIVAPFLRCLDERSNTGEPFPDGFVSLYSNFHEKVDDNGFFLPSDEYDWIWGRRVRGLIEVPVVHCTYLVRRDVITQLTYDDGSGRAEYVIFSDSARRHGIPQFLDNREIYGYLSLHETVGAAAGQLAAALAARIRRSRRRQMTAHRQAAPSPAAGPPSRGLQLGSAQHGSPVFIHSSWRTASTWFWNRFRQCPDTVCYYEPFHRQLASLTARIAFAHDPNSWASAHPRIAPYWTEYVPLLRRAGGVRLYDRAMAQDYFIPVGGLQGDLRPNELRYLALLVRSAGRCGRAPVLGFTRSLGRLAAIKRSCGGFNIFLRRNLWRQWQSYLSLKARNDLFFFNSVSAVVDRDDDEYLAALAREYATRGGWSPPRLDAGAAADRDARNRALLGLSEAQTFALFMALHVYLYVHAELAADLTVDVSRMGNDAGDRSAAEREIRDRTGLAVSFADVRPERGGRPGLGMGPVDWEEISEHGRVAARTLSVFASLDQLSRRAAELIEAARTAMEADDRDRSGADD
jgi:glycosyltransferase involved in cell wall biosynthesis